MLGQIYLALRRQCGKAQTQSILLRSSNPADGRSDCQQHEADGTFTGLLPCHTGLPRYRAYSACQSGVKNSTQEKRSTHWPAIDTGNSASCCLAQTAKSKPPPVATCQSGHGSLCHRCPAISGWQWHRLSVAFSSQ
jgi:hypothetical protein